MQEMLSRLGCSPRFNTPGHPEAKGLVERFNHTARICCITSSNSIKGKKKEADLYIAFIEVPYTQCAQVRITQCYLQITPYLPLPRQHGASQTEVADI